MDTSTAASNEEFRRAFEQHYEYVWSSLRRLGVQARDLEDVAHDVFLEVYRQFPRYDRARPIRPWLFAFAFRMAADYRKLARHKTVLSDDIGAVSMDPSAEDMLARRDDVSLLMAALDTLSLELRAVIILYEIDECPMKDIAEALEITLFTGYSRLRIARARCAEAVGRLKKVQR